MADQKTNKIIVTYGAVVLDDDKVLLVRHLEKAGHKTDMYGLPAGRSEEGEAPEDTVVRELEEETGLKTQREKLVRLPNKYEADIQRSDGSVRKMSIEGFWIKSFTGRLIHSEETFPEWITVKSLDRVNMLPNVEKLVKDAQDIML